jgi:hypothetical protein
LWTLLEVKLPLEKPGPRGGPAFQPLRGDARLERIVFRAIALPGEPAAASPDMRYARPAA